MAITDLRWLGRGALDAVREQSTRRLDGWLADWCVAANRPEGGAEVSALQGNGPGESTRWRRFGEEGQVYVEALDPAAVAGALSGTDTAESALAGNVGREALDDLGQRLADEAAGPTEAEETALPEAWRTQPAGAALLRLALGDLTLHMALSPSLVAAWAPRAEPEPARLVPPGESLGDSRVDVSIELDLGSIPLSALDRLEPGDVLRTDSPLETAFRMHLANGREVGHARLGRRNDRKAVIVHKAS